MPTLPFRKTKLPAWSARLSSGSLRQTIFASITSLRGNTRRNGDFPSNNPFQPECLPVSAAAQPRNAGCPKSSESISTKNGKTKRHRPRNSQPVDHPPVEDHFMVLYEQRLHSRCVDDLKSQRLKFT